MQCSCQCHEKCAVATHAPRVFLSLLFIVSGLGFLVDFAASTQFVAIGLAPWGLASIAGLATAIAIILKLGGGLMLLFNFKTRVATCMLIVFTVLATILYHTNWSGDAAQVQMIQFLKNLAIIGGLLIYSGCFCKTCNRRVPEATPVV